MIDDLLESSLRDDSNRMSNIGLGEEITQLESIEVDIKLLIWYSVYTATINIYKENLSPLIEI